MFAFHRYFVGNLCSLLHFLFCLQGIVILYFVYLSQGTTEVTGSDKKPRHKRNAVRFETYYWLNKIIPYQIVPCIFNMEEETEILRAIEEWQVHTCIRFVPRSTERNYVEFRDGRGCASYVGMQGGYQDILLAKGCREKGTIVHEIGHAVGFVHEQNRPDRDNHVIINWYNIPEHIRGNFVKYSSTVINTYNVPYDYDSLMHYGGKAGSKNGDPTIETLDPTAQEKIGRSTGLSFRDIKLANLMYKCYEGCDSSKTCPGEGFVGKDCRCYCPGKPIKLCSDAIIRRQKFHRNLMQPVVNSHSDVATTNSKIVTTNPSVATTDTAVMTTNPNIAATETDIVTTNPSVATTGTAIMATNPRVAATEPDIVITNPSVAATESDNVTRNPNVAATEPDIVTTNLSVAATETDNVTTNPSVAATESDNVTRNPSVAATEPDIVTTNLSIAATETDNVTANPSVAATEPDIVTTKLGVAATEPDIVTVYTGAMTTSPAVVPVVLGRLSQILFLRNTSVE